jgi:hypothetical protein
MPRHPTVRPETEEVPSCSVLVVSCDRYRDLWKPFFHLFSSYWPDCRFPVYLGANFFSVEHPGVTNLHAGEDKSWSSNLRFFLQQISSEYVLLLLEDFFLDQQVNSGIIEKHLNTLHSLGGTELRLFPNPPFDYALSGHAGLGGLHPLAQYRVSLQAALWNKAKLQQLIRDSESSWEFEVNGTKRSRTDVGGYYCVKQPALHYQHVVERGEWFRAAARRYQGEQIGCDMTARPVMTPARAWKKKVTGALRRSGTFCFSKWLSLRKPQVELNAL